MADNNDVQLTTDEEETPLNVPPLDERIIDLVRRCPHPSSDDTRSGYVIRPAHLASELGLNIDDATRELCGLMSAVGEGASFVFERVVVPGDESSNTSASSAASPTMTMVFTFPHDFDKLALRHRRRADLWQRLQSLSVVIVKSIKIFTAFGLIISLAVLIIAGICLLIAAVVALARGGGGGGGHRGNHPLMLKLRYLLFQLRQILWLYAIFGGGSQQDPFLREVAGDLAFMMSCCVGSSMHPFFWMRLGGMRRRWNRGGSVSRRGWGTSSWRNRNWGDGDTTADETDGIAMVRRGSWGNVENETQQHNTSRANSSAALSQLDDQQRGLLSIAVEFLFGADHKHKELEKWKFRLAIILTLSTTSGGKGVSLREMLPYTDSPPSSADSSSAISEALKVVSYFNGKPLESSDNETSSSGIDSRFCFPEIMAEMDYDIHTTSQKILSLGSSEFAPPSLDINNTFASVLFKIDDDVDNLGEMTLTTTSGETPRYFYERPFVLTELSQQQFGQCALLGLLNFIGIVWIQNAVEPGGLLEMPVASKRRSRGWMIAVSFLITGLLRILRFYAGLFFLLPLCRLIILLIRNAGIERRNHKRQSLVMEH